MAWDPDGLLPPPAAEGHFARRAREKAAAAGAKMQEAGAIRPIPPEHLAAGGLPAAVGSLYDRPAFEVGAACSCRGLQGLLGVFSHLSGAIVGGMQLWNTPHTHIASKLI